MKIKSLVLSLALIGMLAVTSCTKENVDDTFIYHTHFDPPLTLLGQFNSDTLKIDLNKDDLADFGFCWLGYPWTPYLVLLNPNCDYMLQNNGDTSSMTTPEMQWQHHNGYISVEDEYKWCIRLKEGGDYYYGWAFTDAFSEPNQSGQSGHNKLYVALHDIAYCTIPNYPLKWGQTSLHANIEYPLGVYFVNITDEDGQKCVRKVVKE